MIKGWKLSPAWREYYENRAMASKQRICERKPFLEKILRDQAKAVARMHAKDNGKLL